MWLICILWQDTWFIIMTRNGHVGVFSLIIFITMSQFAFKQLGHFGANWTIDPRCNYLKVLEFLVERMWHSRPRVSIVGAELVMFWCFRTRASASKMLTNNLLCMWTGPILVQIMVWYIFLGYVAITWHFCGNFSTGPLGGNLIKFESKLIILIFIEEYKHLKMLSAKCWQFCQPLCVDDK